MVFPVAFFLGGAALGPSTELSGWPFLTAAGACLLFSWIRNGAGRWLALLVGLVLAGVALSTFEAQSSVPAASPESRI